MATFRVWAPQAKSVQVVLFPVPQFRTHQDRRDARPPERPARRPAATERPVDMAAGEGGWWQADVPEARAGDDYAFVLDGGKPLPDPRSAWQPYGVHGASRLVDHAAYAWSDGRWPLTRQAAELRPCGPDALRPLACQGWQAGPLASAVVYELHVGTFTSQGTFEAAIEKLDHLVDLGITHVELMPVNEFPGERGWGYDGVDLYAPHHAYGGPEGLKRLVDACHGRGLAVLLDVVYNHLGPAGNYLGQFGPYFTEHYKTPWGPAVNLDGWGSDEVRRFLIDNALMWLRDYHFDGLRLDAVHAIYDSSAVHFLEELAADVRRLAAVLGRQLVLIAESDLNNPRVVQSPEAGGYGMDAQWSDDFHHALHTVLTGERRGYYEDFGSLADLAKSLERAFVYDGRYSRHRGRRHGRPVGMLSGHRFLGYLQDHDQVGNRARGERTSELLSVGRLKIGAAMVLASPFVPMLFQGEEWAAGTPFQYFTDHQDPGLGKAVTEGRRREFAAFGWKPEEVPDPQAIETFERSRLDWGELGRPPHAEVLDWHRRLIQLRRSTPALNDGRLEGVGTCYDGAARWLTMRRGPVVVACNLAEEAQVVPLEGAGVRAVLLASESGIRLEGEGVRLPGESVAILETGGAA